MFKEVSTTLDFTQQEEDVLSFWQENQIFEKSIHQQEGKPPFIFLEGPPFANAPPGVHHVLARIMKDAVCRYKTMTGHQVQRKAGWDTHGLPVEYQVEKQLNIRNKQDLEAYGVGKFIQKCKENVFQYEQDWRRMTERIGFWVNLDDPYITLSNDYIESAWWVLKQAWEKDLLLHGHKVQPYCPRCGTTLASHEVAQGYQTVIDPSIYVKFRLKDRDNTFFLVWTTTPWTLPSNVAIVVGSDYDYATVEQNGEELILAKELIPIVFGEETPKIRSICKGQDLVGLSYQPLFDFAGELEQKGFYVIAGDFVTLNEGTGLVHTAPAFGQDDYEMLLQHDLPFVQLVDTTGRFVESVTPWQGQFVKDADPKVIEDLVQRGLMFRVSEYEHEYPFCWRCETPLLYYARQSWFIRTTAIRDQMIQHNQQINWYPDHIKDGRFGRWLENNVDWCLTRERYWGTPLPAWICDICDHRHVVGSVSELEKLAPDTPADLELHRPHIDNVTFDCPQCAGTMRRVEDVIDCWFDSGVAHTAQWHYPFENQEKLEASYPADFISEAVDQTRGWFYSLLATGTLLYDKPPYKNVLCLELINAADGTKMSKSRGNTVDPWDILNKQGADAMRWYFYTSCTPWTPRAFQEELIDEALRKFMGTLHNVYSFFVMYANLDQIDLLDHPPISERTIMDQWLLSKLNSTVEKVRSEMESYHLTNAPRAVADFVDELSNWYVRRSRHRFWGAEAGINKQAAYVTLYQSLVTVSKLLAPFTPFMADAIYRNLVCAIDSTAPESVHLAEFPTIDTDTIDKVDTDLEQQMDLVREVIVLGRAARNRSGIKTRQPLSTIQIGGLDTEQQSAVNRLHDLIFDELNVKSVGFVESVDQFTSYTAKANFSTLGPKYGKSVQAIAKALATTEAIAIKRALEQNGKAELVVDGQTYLLQPEEIELTSAGTAGYTIETGGQKFVALSTELTEDLILEGFARELVNKIQQQRKAADFNVSDRIKLSIQSTPVVHQAFDLHQDYILSETLTTEVVVSLSENQSVSGDFSGVKGKGKKAFAKQHNINGETTHIQIEQIAVPPSQRL